MSKQFGKKLTINKKTLSNLGNDQLGRVYGGITGPICSDDPCTETRPRLTCETCGDSCNGTCYNSCNGSCATCNQSCNGTCVTCGVTCQTCGPICGETRPIKICLTITIP